MHVFFITFRSVTPAQRGESILNRSGHRCALQRTPKWMEEQGCGYCLRLRMEDISPCVQLLRMYRIPFRRVYRQNDEGLFEEALL